MSGRIIAPRKKEEGMIKNKQKMMLFKAFFILSVLLCSSIIQPSVAAKDLAHDTQTKSDVQKPVDATSTTDDTRIWARTPKRGQPDTKGCKKYYSCRGPPTP